MDSLIEYYGRSVDGHAPYQLLKTHIAEVSKYMSEYCQGFTQQEIGDICGVLHDIGKYSAEFQRRIRGESIKVEHAIAGAKIVAEHGDNEVKDGHIVSAIIYYLLSYVIAGHHTGLPDFGNENDKMSSLYKRLQTEIPDYSKWKTEIDIQYQNFDAIIDDLKFIDKETLGFYFFFYTHFLFSSLIDADRTSAANFPVPLQKQVYPTLVEMLEILEKYMETFLEKTGELNSIRHSILISCREAADKAPGMFTLTVPTGGGKTLASLSFALKHAVHNSMDRVIYTIPFTSIIEQNAAVYKNIFGVDNVLEHHSNFFLPEDGVENDDDIDDPSKLKESRTLQLAAENWNVPLIMTTNVQFFESLFSAHPSKSRKVHNIANSVIILDEVQALPNELLKPCMCALTELVKHYHCTVVLCTATQPDFKSNGLLSDVMIEDIVHNYPELSEKMRRADCKYIGIKSNKDIAELLLRQKQVLCIVNTKPHAKDLYDIISSTENCYHLSTNMYPAHRKKVISEIKNALNEGKTCRVVSTQLIEAGVDIDFPVVFRSLAGVDSIIQAAGRCNREGKLSVGNVFVFEPEIEYIKNGYLKQTADITSVFKDEINLLSDDAVKRYFKELFSVRCNQLDRFDIINRCSQAFDSELPPQYPFRKISSDFKMISDEGVAVVIPVVEARRYLDELNENNISYIQKKISPYCVNIRPYCLNMIYEKNLVYIEKGVFAVLSSMNSYNNNTGLSLNVPLNQEFLFY